MGFIASFEIMRAVVISDHVSNFAGQMNSPVGAILGAVIAHEIGHLLLPTGNAVAGIMREHLSYSDVVALLKNRLDFHPEQAAVIRREVARRLNACTGEPSAVTAQGLEDRGAHSYQAIQVQAGSVSGSQ